MKKLAFAVLLSAVVAAPAVAADTPFYIGVKAGTADKKVTGTSESSGAFGVFGGYAFNPNFAVELGYTDLGSVASGAIKFTTFDVSAVGSYPINEQFSLYGKLGMANTKEKGFGASETRSAVTFGLGGQLNVNQSVGFRLGFDRHSFGGGTTFVKGDSDLVSVAALFRF